MRRDFIIYSFLLILGLSLAYYASLPLDQSNTTETKWFNIDIQSIKDLHFSSKNVDINAKKDGKKFWITYTAKNSKGSSSPEIFLANKYFIKSLKSFSPFYVLRIIGSADNIKLKDFGLDGSSDKDFFSITDGASKKLELTLGRHAYNTGNIYALDKKQNKVILFTGKFLDNFQRANLRFFERNVLNLNLDDVTSAEIISKSNKKELYHTKRAKNGRLVWTDSNKKNAPPKEAYNTWFDRINKIRIQKFADNNDKLSITNSKLFLTIKFKNNGAVLQTLKFKKDSKDKKNLIYWIKSDYLEKYVKVSPFRMESIENDIKVILN